MFFFSSSEKILRDSYATSAAAGAPPPRRKAYAPEQWGMDEGQSPMFVEETCLLYTKYPDT